MKQSKLAQKRHKKKLARKGKKYTPKMSMAQHAAEYDRKLSLPPETTLTL